MHPDTLALMAKINKKFGAGTIIPASEYLRPARFPTGSPSLDLALGGGWPGNQWAEVIGMESSGKTTVVLKSIAACQKANPEFTALWVAAEPYDVEWAQTLGIDNKRILRHSTTAMEDAYTVMLEAAASRAVDAIVLDSYPALIPDEEAAKAMDESTVGLGARLTGKFFRKAGYATARSLTGEERPLLGIVINQWREKIGGYSPQGTPRTTPGGLAKNFAFYTRLEVSRAEWIDEKIPDKGAVRCGQVIKAKTIKNKSAAPQKVASMDFYFQDTQSLGFQAGDYDVVKELVTLGVLMDIITRAGAYFAFGTMRLRGRDALVDYLRGDLTAQEELHDAVFARAFLPGGG